MPTFLVLPFLFNVLRIDFYYKKSKPSNRIDFFCNKISPEAITIEGKIESAERKERKRENKAKGQGQQKITLSRSSVG